MFFGKIKRIAAKVTEALLADFRLAFASSKYLKNETEGLSFPFGFFSDDYISGFITGYVASMVNLIFDGNHLSNEKRDEILFRVLDQISGNDSLQMKINISKIIKANESEFSTFFRGYDEASYYVALRLGVKLRDDIDSPVLTKAREIAPSLHGSAVNLASPDIQLSTSSSVASALFLLTIKDHVKKNYLI